MCRLLFQRSCSWKLFVQPDDNSSIFSRKKWWQGFVQLNFFYTFNVQNLTDSVLKGTLALTVSELKEDTGLSISLGYPLEASFQEITWTSTVEQTPYMPNTPHAPKMKSYWFCGCFDGF